MYKYSVYVDSEIAIIDIIETIIVQPNSAINVFLFTVANDVLFVCLIVS